MIDYSLDHIHYPEDDLTKLTVTFNEGDHAGAEIVIEKLEVGDDDMLHIDYTLIAGPDGLSETDEAFLEDFKIVMSDVMNKIAQNIIEQDEANKEDSE